jgi:hypothetical protein
LGAQSFLYISLRTSILKKLHLGPQNGPGSENLLKIVNCQNGQKTVLSHLEKVGGPRYPLGSQPMLGVLFFLLSPPIHKGATHTIQRFHLAPSSPRKAKLPLLSEMGIPNPTSKSVKSLFLQHNVTQTEDPPSSFFLLHYIEFRYSFIS